MSKRYVVVDLETTGNSWKDGKDRITQIAAVVVEDGEILEIFSSFVNPKREIPPFITELTGIDENLVKQAPLFCDVAPMVAELLQGAYFVAHNVHFDWNFLKEELKQAGYGEVNCPKIDTVELAQILLPTADSYKLRDLAKKHELEHDQPHRADSDALVTAELFLQFLNQLEKLPLVTLQSLYELSDVFQSDIANIISENILNKVMLGTEDAKEYEVYRNIALRKRNYSLEIGDDCLSKFDAFLHKSMGQLELKMPNFEQRESQQRMMKEIYTALRDSRFSLIEAGTGTGKTLAYLLPSIYFAKRREEPVVISTQTVQLQQQMIENEIPLLQSILPFPFEVALLKGRKHYLCLHKFEYALQEEEKNYDAALTKAKVLVWLLQTETGDRDELNIPEGGKLLWDRICSDTYSPGGMQSNWFSRCFYQRAKNKALFADIVITNHALLFQDFVSEDPLLASCEHIIFDEAHHIEETATRTLGEQFSCMYFQLILSRFGTLETDDVLSKVYELMKKSHHSSRSAFRMVSHRLKEIKFDADELFQMLRTFIFQQTKQEQGANNMPLIYRYNADQEDGKLWRSIAELTNRFVYEVRKILTALEQQADLLQSKIEWEMHVVTGEFMHLIELLRKMVDSLQLLILEKTEYVTWMETETKGTIHSTVLYAQPVHIGERFADEFLTKKRSVIFTSATLTVNNTFDYIQEQLGLYDFAPDTLTVPSPFHYEEQVKLMVSTDVPLIKQVSEDVYIREVSHHIMKIAKATNGRMLVLFTSYEMLKETYTNLKQADELEDFVLLTQSVHNRSRSRLVRKFQEFDKAILLGTSSFWEGIDIPGDALSYLVIVRLPFTPPHQPMMEAKSEWLKNKGDDVFTKLALPQAILRFKQGFGRLIRTMTDTGTVFVLDRRLTNSFYGKRFMQSIPNVPLYEGSLEELLDHLEE
ncbi:ATP-dependent DNA helicase DinG [Bacillus pseudomycoides]|uniref:ATP-dependent DNA helicase DinG n=1 Tax=Bacillus pseudomycoides TaxID=64104 RepID=UPI000BF15535|nr:ATP-dependent DNA helicase DinG [Bacillus pseudomycoides]PEI47361.1 ATP-dependent helicase DinG [Bacillus pseudomycoides]PGA73397.1 ATP-dependent helicase DinG [Bacillus pseudomycoides]PHE11271.1 ATP-dependent helicase DinG [Bacillus pseudomycoides]PHE98035.1 ATP-dependent helicase DinG [Bacillus pseudomycoides]